MSCLLGVLPGIVITRPTGIRAFDASRNTTTALFNNILKAPLICPVS